MELVQKAQQEVSKDRFFEILNEFTGYALDRNIDMYQSDWTAYTFELPCSMEAVFKFDSVANVMTVSLFHDETVNNARFAKKAVALNSALVSYMFLLVK